MMKFYHHTTDTMAQPRKAMKALGFQGCCLRCDAEDVSGLKRCKSCIDYHKLVKNMILENDDSILIQHMKDLYAMLSNPEMFDVDEVHGKELLFQQSLIAEVDFDEGYVYPEEISDLFGKSENVERRIMEDLVNKNPWKNNPPSKDVVRLIGLETWSEDELSSLEYDGRITKPSKNIQPTSKEERLGEDITIKINDSAEVDDKIKEKQKQKRIWQDLVDDILDDI